MDTHNAICECKGMSEHDTVIALRRGRFHFIEDWGLLTWIGVTVMFIATGSLWLGAILGWHISDILNPKFFCNQCNSEINRKQFRS